MKPINISKIISGVESTGDFLVFRVKSSNPNHCPYRVDMQKFQTCGDCDCPAFSVSPSVMVEGKMVTKRRALIMGVMPSIKLKCKHIIQVDLYLSTLLKHRMIQERDIKSNANKKTAKEARPLGHRVPKPAQTPNEPGNMGEKKTARWSGGQTPFAKPKTPETTYPETWGPPD